MPAILRGFRTYFWSHDGGDPPHVHVERGSATAKFWLAPVALASNAGFTPREVNAVLRLVRKQETNLLEDWRAFFNAEEIL